MLLWRFPACTVGGGTTCLPTRHPPSHLPAVAAVLPCFHFADTARSRYAETPSTASGGGGVEALPLGQSTPPSLKATSNANVEAPSLGQTTPPSLEAPSNTNVEALPFGQTTPPPLEAPSNANVEAPPLGQTTPPSLGAPSNANVEAPPLGQTPPPSLEAEAPPLGQSTPRSLEAPSNADVEAPGDPDAVALTQETRAAPKSALPASGVVKTAPRTAKRAYARRVAPEAKKARLPTIHDAAGATASTATPTQPDDVRATNAAKSVCVGGQTPQIKNLFDNIQPGDVRATNAANAVCVGGQTPRINNLFENIQPGDVRATNAAKSVCVGGQTPRINNLFERVQATYPDFLFSFETDAAGVLALAHQEKRAFYAFAVEEDRLHIRPFGRSDASVVVHTLRATDAVGALLVDAIYATLLRHASAL